ncbi:MAG: hypothetical protein KDC00_12130, partial [Flavobacteriales bacterium]|nr:hypothetical protein [Flavobacteriales bacterium]
FTNNFNSSTVDYLSNTFQSNISWTHLWIGKPYNLTANARHAQNTLTGSFDVTLPSLTFNLQRIFPFQDMRPVSAPSRFYDQIGIAYTANFDNVLRTTEDQIYLGNVSNLINTMQNGVRQTVLVSSTVKNKFFSLNPDFRGIERWYTKTLRKTYDAETNSTTTDTVPGFSRVFEWNAGATLTSKLYGMYTFRGKTLKAIRHVVTPSVGFTYRPDGSTQIFGPFGPNGTTSSYSPYDIGIYGKPAAGESGAVSVGLIQNLEAKVRDRKATADSAGVSDDVQYKKIKLFDFVGVNSSYDLLKDSVRWSPMSVAARTTLFNKLNINFNSLWDPYAVDFFGQRTNASEQSVNGRLFRMLYTNVAAGFDLKSKRYGTPTASGNTNDQQVVEDSDPSKGARVNFSLPWRLGVNYSYNLNRSYVADTTSDSEQQSILFNGDVTVLKHWKLGFSSGYDIVAEEWTPTSLNLYWDLHCWEFNFNIIPIGVRKSFTFRINVKASILKDLKLEQRQPYGNDRNLLF